jgi:hypothetical protein
VVTVGEDAGSAGRELHILRSFVGLASQVIAYDGVTAAAPIAEDPLAQFGGEQVAPAPLNVARGFRIDVLERYGGGFIWLHARAPDVVREVVSEATSHFGQWLLGLPSGAGRPGPIGFADELGFHGPEMDKTSVTHRLRTLESAHGLTLCVPRYLAAAGDDSTSDFGGALLCASKA